MVLLVRSLMPALLHHGRISMAKLAETDIVTLAGITGRLHKHTQVYSNLFTNDPLSLLQDNNLVPSPNTLSIRHPGNRSKLIKEMRGMLKSLMGMTKIRDQLVDMVDRSDEIRLLHAIVKAIVNESCEWVGNHIQCVHTAQFILKKSFTNAMDGNFSGYTVVWILKWSVCACILALNRVVI